MEALSSGGRADLVFRTGGSFGIMIKEGGAPKLAYGRLQQHALTSVAATFD
jgi:hypothetical protein